jgi:hypothetical protein
MADTGPPMNLRLVRWTPGDCIVARGQIEDGSHRRPLVALEAIERLAAVLASTAEPQLGLARRLMPEAPSEPVGLLTTVRSARVYLALESGSTIEVECTVAREPDAELVLVKGEARNGNGQRAAKAELQYLLVPGAGEHLRDAQLRDATRTKLLGDVT